MPNLFFEENMKIKVKLFATLRENRGKIVDLDVEHQVNVLHIMNILEIKKEDIAILLVNGLDATLDTILSENDTLSVFPPIGGG